MVVEHAESTCSWHLVGRTQCQEVNRRWHLMGNASFVAIRKSAEPRRSLGKATHSQRERKDGRSAVMIGDQGAAAYVVTTCRMRQSPARTAMRLLLVISQPKK